jgi:hypothetical protein
MCFKLLPPICVCVCVCVCVCAYMHVCVHVCHCRIMSMYADYVTSSYILCHIIIHTMSHHHTDYEHVCRLHLLAVGDDKTMYYSICLILDYVLDVVY